MINKSGIIAGIILSLLTLTAMHAIVATEAQQNVIHFAVWYTLPPTPNWNPFAPNTPLIPAQQAYCTLPLFVVWHHRGGIIFPVLGEDLSIDLTEGSLTVKIAKGHYWYNGTHVYPFTAKDVWTYYVIQWKIFQNFQPWLLDVKVVDDYTVKFYFNKSGVALTAPLITDSTKTFTYSYSWVIYFAGFGSLLTWPITTPYEVFGKYAEMVYPLPPSEINATALQNEIQSMQISSPWCNGPFWYDPTTLTVDGVIMKKNPHSPFAPKIKYDIVEIHYARASEQMNTYMLEGKCAWAWHGLPASLIIAISQTKGTGQKGVYAWNYDMQGVWFNINKYPLNITEVRQAILMLINRTFVSLSYPPMFWPYEGLITGLELTFMPPDYSPLPREVVDNLYDWSYNPEKAFQLLERAGLRRGPDGKWYLPDGSPFRVEIASVSLWADWVAVADALATNLKNFGIVAEVRLFPDMATWWNALSSWDFDISLMWNTHADAGIIRAYTGFLNQYWIGWQLQASRFNYTWPVPIKNGTTIYVNPYVEQLRLQAALPLTPEWWDSLIKLIHWWNYYVPAATLFILTRPFEINIKQIPFAELLGPPDKMVLEGQVPFYDRGKTEWWFAWLWWGVQGGAYLATFIYGLVGPDPRPPDEIPWPPPPTAKPVDMLELVEKAGYRYINLSAMLQELLEQLKPTATPTPKPTSIPAAATTITVTTTVTYTATMATTVSSITTTTATQTVTDWTTTAIVAIVLLVVGFAIGYLVKRR